VSYSVSKGIRVFQDCAAIHEDVERCYSDVQYAYSDKCVWVDGPRKVFAQEVKRAYWACISYVDAQVGRIVAALKAEGLYDSTVISFNGDHGYRESSSTTRPVLSCPALPCPALPCPALPCPALPCSVLSCPAIPARFLPACALHFSVSDVHKTTDHAA
jgi:hypothetical protein